MPHQEDSDPETPPKPLKPTLTLSKKIKKKKQVSSKVRFCDKVTILPSPKTALSFTEALTSIPSNPIRAPTISSMTAEIDRATVDPHQSFTVKRKIFDCHEYPSNHERYLLSKEDGEA